ncbi:DegV family protein [Limnochorda pilosa]|uniref:DegV family protein n=1 Tax=Limnochorda pilosa TaxID=1555112 RepID=A0A0K2SIJ0_LIMPI|nr:DegV family protein [Limnochorda pilosa]BAS26946.1 hypothetical protein LIP_1089 [Limnochorda pilosa]
MRLGIAADTTAAFPQEVLEANGITLAPVGLVIDGEVYRDRLDLTAEAFYEMRPHLKELPTTTGVSPGDYLRAMEDHLPGVDGVLVLSPARKLSVTYTSAVQAAEAFSERHPEVPVAVIDTETAAGGEAVLALEAARYGREAESLEQVAEHVRRLVPRARTYMVLSTLKYLVHIGRAGKAAALAASALQVKPVLRLGQEFEPAARPMGWRQGLDELVRRVEIEAPGKGRLYVAVNHVRAPERADSLIAEIRQRFDPDTVLSTDLSPVLGYVLGDGSISLGFLRVE